MKTAQTNEQALEQAIEKALTGICREEIIEEKGVLEEPSRIYSGGNGYYIGIPGTFNTQFAIDTARLWNFLENTQPKELEKLKRAGDWKLKVLNRYDRMVKKHGILRLLRKGLDVEDAHLTLFYQLPMASSSEAVKDNFEKNEFSVTRQLHYNSDNLHEEIDMVVFINGIPIATLELKNPWTGQTARVNGIRQYNLNYSYSLPFGVSR